MQKMKDCLFYQIGSWPLYASLYASQVDRRRLAEYTRRFARQATQNVIETEVSNQLNRLFGPGK